ncbi:MAG: T9SS type A sorting domain-containing protein [Bacteroidetes bacterium]|nr:T9SS type A sorting domain-containing protein [Bacteroidota bacterium]
MKTLFKLFAFLIIPVIASAQRTPAVNAILLPDSIIFAGITAISQATITWHPIQKKYYTLRIGNAAFPLQTFSETFANLYQDTTGIDSRGIWYNPNTNQLERNCFNTLGWTTINLNGSGHAINSFTILFSGMNQPTSQSVGAYDFKTNTVIFYSAGSIRIYDRNTGLLASTLPLTGTLFTTVNTESVIYTGETGFEIGLLDYTNKRVLLFNSATGALSGSVQLPSTALTHTQFRFCYANNRVWLFNSALRKWNAYNIWNQPLPVDLTFFKALPVGNGTVSCSWGTASEENNDFFTVEKSSDARTFEEAGRISGAGSSVVFLNYEFNDKEAYNGISYYRLKQTDFDGQFSYSQVVAVNVLKEKSDLTIFPNPATDYFKVSLNASRNESYSLKLVDATGKVFFQQSGLPDEVMGELTIATDKIPAGIYFVEYYSNDILERCKVMIQ